MHQKILSQAFAPAHISGIFIIDIKKDPVLSGSMGAGICLEDGSSCYQQNRQHMDKHFNTVKI
jgi:pantoate kinase